MVLRRSSIDEVPQLLNVIRGEMSLVGPGPTPSPMMITTGFAVRICFRHHVKPGITGWAQVRAIEARRRASTDEG